MKKIKTIYESLDRTEKRILKRHLKPFQSGGEGKLLDLLTLVEKNPDITRQHAASILYGDAKSKAFIMLKKRLYEKILEVLILSTSLENSPVFSRDNLAKDSIVLQKEIVQAHYLRKKGLNELSRMIMEKCADKSEKLGLPGWRTIALDTLRTLLDSRKEGEAMHGEIIESWETYKTDLMGMELLFNMRVNLMGRDLKDAYLIKELTHYLNLFAERLTICDSPRTRFHYLYFLAALHRAKREYKKSLENLNELSAHFEKHPGIADHTSVLAVYHRRVDLAIVNYQWELGLQLLDQALHYCPPERLNYLTISRNKIRALICSNKLNEAEKIIASLSKFKSWNLYKFEIAQVTYFEACMAFITQKYPQAIKLVHECSELNQNKEGWNVNIRIIEILSLIEQQYLDSASSKIENMRKHIAKYEVLERSQLALKGLKMIERNSFDLLHPSKALTQLVHRIQTGTKWDSLSSEVIRFEVWVEAHAAGISYYDAFLTRLQAEKSQMQKGEKSG